MNPRKNVLLMPMAELVAALHICYVCFIAITPMVLLLYGLLGVENQLLSWARRLHIAALLFVAMQYLFDWSCPLTVLENQLRGLPTGDIFLGAPQWLASGGALSSLGWILCSAYLTFTLFAYQFSRKIHVL